jgi:hypothetical protein
MQSPLFKGVSWYESHLWSRKIETSLWKEQKLSGSNGWNGRRAFDLYLDELLKWNEKINLTAIRTGRGSF